MASGPAGAAGATASTWAGDVSGAELEVADWKDGLKGETGEAGEADTDTDSALLTLATFPELGVLVLTAAATAFVFEAVPAGAGAVDDAELLLLRDNEIMRD